MAMDFPNSPVVGQVFSSGSRQWVWTGTTWDSPAAGTPGIVSSTGGTFTGDITAPNYAGRGNAIINGAFDIWQRGTSFTVGTAFPYTADRFQVIRGGVVAGMTVSRQSVSDSTNLPNIQFAARVQRDSGNTSTNYLEIGQSLETANSIPLAGKTITFSYYARAGANFSAASSLLNAIVTTGTGNDQNITTTAFTGAVDTSQNSTLTSNWQRFQLVVNVGNTVRQLAIRFRRIPTGTAGANDWFEITGLQLEAGSVATPFKRNANSLQGELAACQRYYVRFGGDDLFQFFASGIGATTTRVNTQVILPVPMRVRPTSVEFATPIAVQQNAAAAITAVSTLSIAGAYHNRFSAGIEATTTGVTVGQPYWLISNNSTSAFVGLSAEL